MAITKKNPLGKHANMKIGEKIKELGAFRERAEDWLRYDVGRIFPNFL